MFLLNFLPIEINNLILFEQGGLQTKSAMVIKDHFSQKKKETHGWLEEYFGKDYKDEYYLGYIEFCIWKLNLPDHFKTDIPLEKRKRQDVTDWLTECLIFKRLKKSDLYYVGI